jgi:hypothetical protein
MSGCDKDQTPASPGLGHNSGTEPPKPPHLGMARRAVWRKGSGLSAAARSIGAYLMNMKDDFRRSSLRGIEGA